MFGPSLSKRYSTSNQIFIRAMNNNLKAIIKIGIPFVDVRDAASAHVLCILEKRVISNAKRYLVTEGCYWLSDLVDVLRDEFEKQGYPLTKRQNNNKIVGQFLLKVDKHLALFSGYFGRLALCDNTRSKTELGIVYKYFRETVLDSAFDYLAKGVVKIRQASSARL